MPIDSCSLNYPPGLRDRAEANPRLHPTEKSGAPSGIPKKQLLFMIFLLIGIIFLVDILMPLRFAIWVFYDVPLLMTSRFTRNRLLYLTASLISLVTMAGIIFGIDETSVSADALNRAASVISIWIIAFLLQKYRFSKQLLWLSEELRETKDELEEQVWRRTVDLEKTIECLRTEISGRELAENKIREYREHLEELVAQRTEELTREIVERKHAEQALRESEERFRGLVEATSDWIWEVEEHMQYIYASPQVCKLLGYDPEEMIGKTPFDFMSREEADRVNQAIGLQIEHHQPITAAENTNIRKNGTEVVLETSGVPVFGPDGSFSGYRGIDRDITERKQAEAALRESEERFRLALENSATTVFSQDRELRYTWIFNPLAGNVESYIGKKESEILGQKDAEFFARIRKRVMETGQDDRGEYALPVNGSNRSFSYIIKPHRNARGEIIGVITAATDVTLIRQAEEQARQLAERLRRQTVQLETTNKELESFSYSISHDLRAPLRTLDGFSTALLEDYADRLDAEGQNYLTRIRAAARRMARLIDDLLDLSRTARAELHYTTVGLSVQAKAVIEELRQTEPGRTVETIVQEGITTEGDEILLRQVL
ncbi:MAG: PAS domain-containing sensor histidine kinase, partial [Candidatus Latescibacterota bacterium]